MKISEKNEGTSYPFWIIIDPEQNFSKCNQGIHNIASMITGVWLSREEAEEHLKARRYNFGINAKVYCHSGYWSNDWKELSDMLKSNANLIAAAPEMLEALRCMVEAYESIMDVEYGYSPGQIQSTEYIVAKNIIKKATE